MFNLRRSSPCIRYQCPVAGNAIIQGKSRALSYTTQERQQSAAETINHRYAAPPQSKDENASIPRHIISEKIAAKEQQLGRYSRRPLGPMALLDQLAHTPRIPGKSQSYEQKIRPYVPKMIKFDHYMEQFRYDQAWDTIQALEQDTHTNLMDIWEHIGFDDNLILVVSWPIHQWFKVRSRGTGNDKVAASLRSPIEVVQYLRKLGFLTPSILFSILHHTLLQIITQQSRGTSSDTALLQEGVSQAMWIWHQSFSQFHVEASTQLKIFDYHDVNQPWDWSFLPTKQRVIDDHVVMDRYHLRKNIARYLRPLTRIPRPPDYASAIIMTKYIMSQRYARSQDDTNVIPVAYEPLLSLLDALLQYSLTPSYLPPRLQRAFNYGNKALQEVIMQSFQLSFPTPRQVSSDQEAEDSSNPQYLEDSSDAESKEADSAQTIMSNLDTTAQEPEVSAQPAMFVRRLDDEIEFIKKCKIRAMRVVERQDLLQADRILAEVLSYQRQHKTKFDKSLWDRLLQMYMRVRRPKRALQVLNIMNSVGCQADAATWSVLLRYTQSQGSHDTLFEFWDVMKQSGVQPDKACWSALVFSLVLQHRPRVALQALERMGDEWKASEQHPGAIAPDVSVGNAFIAACSHQRSDEYMAYVPAVLQWMRQHNLEPDVYTYNALMRNTMEQGKLDEALVMLKRMQDEGIAADASTGTALLGGLMSSDRFDNLSASEQTQQVLEIINDIESNYIHCRINRKSYAIVVHTMLRRYANVQAASACIERMRQHGEEPGAHIYTIFFTYHTSLDPPDYQAIESIWTMIKKESDGWGAKLDHIFFDRALEFFAPHHQQLGIEHIDEILSHLPRIGLKPSWWAARSIAQAFVERGDLERLKSLVHQMRLSKTLTADSRDRASGYGAFWDFVIEAGVVREEDILAYQARRKQDMAALQEYRARSGEIIHRNRRRANF